MSDIKDTQVLKSQKSQTESKKEKKLTQEERKKKYKKNPFLNKVMTQAKKEEFKKKGNKKSLSVTIEADQFDFIDSIKVAKDVTYSDVIREIIDHEIERYNEL